MLRLSVVLSILLHGALLALALELPPPARARSARPIEIEVHHAPPQLTPPPVVPPPPEPEKLAMRAETPHERELERERQRQRPEPTPEAPTPTPPQVTPPAQGAPPPVSEAPRGPIDLRLHALPGASGDGIVLPSGAGPSGGMIVGAPRKAWHMRGDAGDPLLGKIKDDPVDDFPLERVGRDEYVYKGKQFSAHILPDGTVNFDDKNIRDFNGTSGTFDLTDLIMRGRKEDPYRAEKKRFMDATAPEREKLAKKARAERMQESLGGLPSHLEAVWELARPAAARRKLLFELWKETASGDDEIGQAGAQARAMIETFIRRRLPEGSPDAFTSDELAAYSRGKRAFDPYK